MLAKQIMTTPVVTVLEDTCLPEVAQTLLKWRISAVPVVDDDERLVGIVSERDLTSIQAPGARGDRGRAKDVMTAAVITAGENETSAALAAMLEEHNVKRVPILRDGCLVGIVSRANLLHALAALPDATLEAIAAAAPDPAPDDRTIRASILNTLRNELYLSGPISVAVSDGVVELRGDVHSEDERSAVCAVAQSMPHVVEVKHRLRVLSG